MGSDLCDDTSDVVPDDGWYGVFYQEAVVARLLVVWIEAGHCDADLDLFGTGAGDGPG
jgi:hypothetical protein